MVTGLCLGTYILFFSGALLLVYFSPDTYAQLSVITDGTGWAVVRIVLLFFLQYHIISGAMRLFFLYGIRPWEWMDRAVFALVAAGILTILHLLWSPLP
jgi:hypothetical protein